MTQIRSSSGKDITGTMTLSDNGKFCILGKAHLSLDTGELKTPNIYHTVYETLSCGRTVEGAYAMFCYEHIKKKVTSMFP